MQIDTITKLHTKISSLIAQAVKLWIIAYHHRKVYRSMLEMNEHYLADMGLNRYDLLRLS